MNLKKMLFKQPNLNEGYNPKSPAEKNARDVWDQREGSVIVQNHNLRRLNIGQLVVNLVLVGAIVFLSTKSSVQPFVVFANPESGEVWNVGTAQEAKDFEPNEAVKKYFMANFIKKIREIPLDPVVRSKNLTTGFSFMTRSAATKLQNQLENEKVQNLVGNSTVTVDIVSIVPMDSNNSYQVRWTETTYGMKDGKKTVTPYSGIFTVQTIKSDDEKQIAINPIGFYISDFNWSKDATAVNDKNSKNGPQQSSALSTTNSSTNTK